MKNLLKKFARFTCAIAFCLTLTSCAQKQSTKPDLPNKNNTKTDEKETEKEKITKAPEKLDAISILKKSSTFFERTDIKSFSLFFNRIFSSESDEGFKYVYVNYTDEFDVLTNPQMVKHSYKSNTNDTIFDNSIDYYANGNVFSFDKFSKKWNSKKYIDPVSKLLKNRKIEMANYLKEFMRDKNNIIMSEKDDYTFTFKNFSKEFKGLLVENVLGRRDSNLSGKELEKVKENAKFNEIKIEYKVKKSDLTPIILNLYINYNLDGSKGFEKETTVIKFSNINTTTVTLPDELKNLEFN